jgi:hypothetical protein
MKRGHVAIVGLFAAACSGTSNPGAPLPPARPGDWTCVGRGATTPAPAAAQPPTTFELSLEDVYTHAPVGALLLAVCARADEDCATPRSHGKADLTGRAALIAPGDPSSFDGFVRVSGEGIATHYVFLADRTGTGTSRTLVVPIYTPSALDMTTRMTGLKLDVKGGLVRVDLQDCGGEPAKDVVVSIGSFGCSQFGAMQGLVKAGFPFGPKGCAPPIVAYATGGQGSMTRAALATDETGVALGFGVPPGPLGVAQVVDGKTVAGALGFTRGGAVSEFVVRPRLSPAPPRFSLP